MLNSHPSLSAAQRHRFPPQITPSPRRRPSLVPARSLTLWIPVRGTSGPLPSWFPAVAAGNPGTSCFQGSRLSQTTELRSSQQDSRGGAWPVGHASDTPLRPLRALSTVYSALWERRAPPRTRPSPPVLLRPPRPSGSGWVGRPRPQHTPPPRPAPL